MRKFFFVISISFFIILLINVVWTLVSFYYVITRGLEFVLHGESHITNIINYSLYLKWILLTDGLWIVSALIYTVNRTKYKTISNLHYLQYNPIVDPRICVIIPAYNEEMSIEKVVKDFLNQKLVRYVIVIDNNSSDNTASIAENMGAKVIRKKENKGYAHSLVLGLKESLKTDANIVVVTEADGTYNAYDVSKMLPYLDNCDMVIGTRQVQVLTEKGNQNSIIHVWGNLLVAKLIQFKYFNLRHVGFVNLTDVGCVFRSVRRDLLEKISDKLTISGTDEATGGIAIGLYLTMLAVEHDMRVVEIPITFNKRIGTSKLRSNEKFRGILIGISFLWFVLTS